jgi:prepilin-type N-terminal cleavage/methylation domain-containing protein
MKTMKQGFTLVEIMIVVAIIGLLAAIAIPSFMKARTTSQMNACINNLKQIDAAKDQWAMEARKGSADAVVYSDLVAFLKNPVAATNCPSGGTVSVDVVSNSAVCTITGHVQSN